MQSAYDSLVSLRLAEVPAATVNAEFWIVASWGWFALGVALLALALWIGIAKEDEICLVPGIVGLLVVLVALCNLGFNHDSLHALKHNPRGWAMDQARIALPSAR